MLPAKCWVLAEQHVHCRRDAAHAPWLGSRLQRPAWGYALSQGLHSCCLWTLPPSSVGIWAARAALQARRLCWFPKSGRKLWCPSFSGTQPDTGSRGLVWAEQDTGTAKDRFCPTRHWCSFPWRWIAGVSHPQMIDNSQEWFQTRANHELHAVVPCRCSHWICFV